MARILFDLDNTGVDFLGPVVAEIANMRGEPFDVWQIKDWGMSIGLTDRERSRAFELWRSDGYFRHLVPFPGFVETVQWAKDHGHEPLIVTAAKKPGALKEKAEWCQEHLPFLTCDELIVMEPKHLLNAEVLVDDNPKQVRNFRKHHPDALILCPSYSFNKEVEELCNRIYGADDMEAFWNQVQFDLARFSPYR